MGRLLLSIMLAGLFSLTSLNAQGMNKEKCDMPNCKMEMKKENCKCGMKKENCNMPKCKMKDMKKGSCGAGKCGASMMNKNDMAGNAGKKMQGSCGAGKCGADMKNMKKEKCDMPNCKMKEMNSKPKCDCKNGGECKCKASGKECKCGAKAVKEKVEKCGCGMTVESCKKMMIKCKYRDEREAKESQQQ